jgi:tetratricopeptide (TPR) repeat protein
LTTNERREARLAEALQAADQAVLLAPDDSSAHAIRAFVLDWNAFYQEGDDVTDMLIEAEKAAQRALVLDQNNVLALAYSSEILLDQLKYDQAQQYIDLALQRGGNLMDVHRVHAGLLETLGSYQLAIAAYERAIEIAPNLTFLYIRVGVIYRFLGMSAANQTLQMQNYEKALEFFARAVDKNKQLGIEDPNPYLAIGKVYSQMGEFFIASRNVERAVQIDPTSQDLYAELGMVYWRARNYEGAIPALKCAVKGCTPAESCEVRKCDPALESPIEITGIPLRKGDQITVVYYYTYGSVLAGMYRPVGETAEYCDRSLEVLGEVRSLFGDDPSIMAIVESSEAICASFGVTRGNAP